MSGQEEPSVELLVEDWDRLSGNDFMGRLEIPLAAFRDRQRDRRWWKLLGPPAPPPEGDDNGDDDDSASVSAQLRKGAKGLLGGGGGGGGGGGVVAKKKTTGGQLEVSRGELELVLRWGYNTELEPDFTLRLSGLTAHNLPETEVGGRLGLNKQDPYARFRLGAVADERTTIERGAGTQARWEDGQASPVVS